MPSMPVRGRRSRPVRLRPPSMKNSIGWPRFIITSTYFMNTIGYRPEPRKLRRMKNAPPLRSSRPITGRFRLTPAAT